jgi:DNA-binding NarL/FixJ family response regulator
MKTLYALVDSPFASHFPDLYQELGIVAQRFDSARNLHRALQKQPPDFFVGEFIYGWGNDYAGATVSNLDVTLRTLQAAAPQAKIIVLMQASEEAHIGKLLALFSVHAVLKYPITADQMRDALQSPA